MTQKSRTDVYDSNSSRMNASQLERARQQKQEAFQQIGVMPDNPYVLTESGAVTRATPRNETYVQRKTFTDVPTPLGRRGKDE